VRTRVLLVEDDELIGTMVEMNLAQSGHAVTWAHDGESALAAARATRFDAVVLDLMLPGIDGLEVAASLRGDEISTPVLMLTARGEIETKVKALDLGIDDYLVKPFDMNELLARVRAMIRRGRAAGELPAEELLPAAGGRLDLDGLLFVDAGGSEHHLSEKEAAVLALFARNPGRTLTRAEVLEEAWGLDSDPTERTVDNFVLRLRRLVEADPDHPRHLTTVRGKGYRWEP
jgi:two-component system alkaline phosphatase synthesis response regulator PhoP